MLEPQDHAPQLLFDDPTFDTDAVSAATLLGIGRTRLSQITSSGSLPYLRRKIGDRFRVFYRRADLEKRIALRYAFAQSSHPPAAKEQVTAVSSQNHLKAGASAGAVSGPSEIESQSESRAPALTDPLSAGTVAIPQLLTTATMATRRTFVAATKLQSDDNLLARLEGIESSLVELTQLIRNIESNLASIHEEALQTKREHQRELNLLARLIRASSVPQTENAVTFSQELTIQALCSHTSQQKAKKPIMRPNSLKRAERMNARSKKRMHNISE